MRKVKNKDLIFIIVNYAPFVNYANQPGFPFTSTYPEANKLASALAELGFMGWQGYELIACFQEHFNLESY